MFFKSSFLLVISIVASVSALTTPHVPRNHHHRAIAQRAASPNTPHIPPITIRKRADGKRCKARPVSSSPLQPRPTTTPAPPKPSPTPPPEPKPTTEKAPATTKAPSSGGSGGSGPSFMIGTQTGQGTFYDTGLGACGIVNKDTDYIAAVSHLLFDRFPDYDGANPNNNPICGRKVRVTYEGKSITVAITDRCEGCAVTDLDFSPSAFSALAAFSVGRISNMKWIWI
ncbi:RlpA-like double-psi beta-barrel-protein domain-containing protein-containing protein [Collybia nuda]|uniref:RlpA-like double-psi beta-barrel-protein domain-containing protein-containing protein n=1 Tax=Collybia nuda TaxID=64659 RepID=A0A9P6CHE6_9AGAR|nr:RlpA-like double-psi beta-barrel-protein domain-containing protein-containing protein [Collybia nuda]